MVALGAAPVQSVSQRAARSTTSYLEDIREGRRGVPPLASPRSGTGRDPGVNEPYLPHTTGALRDDGQMWGTPWWAVVDCDGWCAAREATRSDISLSGIALNVVKVEMRAADTHWYKNANEVHAEGRGRFELEVELQLPHPPIRSSLAVAVSPTRHWHSHNRPPPTPPDPPSLSALISRPPGHYLFQHHGPYGKDFKKTARAAAPHGPIFLTVQQLLFSSSNILSQAWAVRQGMRTTRHRRLATTNEHGSPPAIAMPT
ncbi:hypothetical protein THAOC_00311, partial [Thalassiosira oceanica]